MKVKFLFALSLAISAYAQTVATPKELDAVYPAAHDLYVDIHQNPELSTHETQTASKLAGRLRSLVMKSRKESAGPAL